MKSGRLVEGVQVDPKVPDGFWLSPEGERPASHMAWLEKPFIVTTPNAHFSNGIRYDVYCLEGENSNHPAIWGMFGTLEEAVERANDGPPWLKAT